MQIVVVEFVSYVNKSGHFSACLHLHLNAFTNVEIFSSHYPFLVPRAFGPDKAFTCKFVQVFLLFLRASSRSGLSKYLTSKNFSCNFFYMFCSRPYSLCVTKAMGLEGVFTYKFFYICSIFYHTPEYSRSVQQLFGRKIACFYLYVLDT